MSRQRSFWIRVAVLPAIVLVVLAAVAALFGAAATRVAAVIAVALLLAIVATFLRGAAQNILVTVVALLFGLVAVEGVALAMLPHVVLVHGPGLWGDRPVIGWGPERAGTYPVEEIIDGKSIYKATYTIDGALLRAVKATPDAPTIGFFGDSFTFGDGLNDGDTLPQQFADDVPGFHTVNLAFSAYSPSQMLRELEVGLFDRTLAAPRLFVLQTGPWHSERTSCKPNFSVRGPRYVLDGGTLHFAGPCTTGAWRRISEFYKELAAYRVFLAPILQRPTHWDMDNYIAIVEAAAKLSRDKYHVPLVVLYVKPAPHYLDGTGFTNAMVRDRLQGAGAHLIDADVEGKPGDVLRIPGDGHPTGTLNHLLARKLVDDLGKTMPEVLVKTPKS